LGRTSFLVRLERGITRAVVATPRRNPGASADAGIANPPRMTEPRPAELASGDDPRRA
jgi:hypothetical protein